MYCYWQPKTMKQNTTYTINTKEKQKKTALANKTNYILVWYAFYDLWPGNRADPILTALEPAQVSLLHPDSIRLGQRRPHSTSLVFFCVDVLYA